MGDAAVWAAFGAIVIALLAADLVISTRGSGAMGTRRALKETAVWIAAALAFGAFVYAAYGAQSATEYYAAYIVEKAMSVDNLFVFILIFSMFGIPDECQHRALFYGVVGAVAFRAVFILAGVELLSRFHFVMYVFGLMLVVAALKTMFKKEEGGRSRVAELLSKTFRCAPSQDGRRLLVRDSGKLAMTPLLMCILVIELTDVVFAADSIPAVLAISTDVLVVYTSNIFAVLGLRSLYFAIRGGLASLRYLKYGLGAILLFVAFKLLAADFVKIPVAASLIVIVCVLGATVAASLLVRGRGGAETRRHSVWLCGACAPLGYFDV